MFVCVCSLCVDTLWHVKFTQPSALISRAQDEVEQVANKFCAENTAMGSLTLSAADKTALEAFVGCAAAGEVGGVTLKKFSANAAKKCIVAFTAFQHIISITSVNYIVFISANECFSTAGTNQSR